MMCIASAGFMLTDSGQKALCILLNVLEFSDAYYTFVKIATSM